MANDSVVLQVRVSADEMEVFKRAAERAEMKLSEWVRETLNLAIKGEAPDQGLPIAVIREADKLWAKNGEDPASCADKC